MAESRQRSPYRGATGTEATPPRSRAVNNHGHLKSTPGLPKKPSAMLSPAKLQRLCQSLISNKLHIPSHDLPEQYVISIPFKLQLPPKLCANTDDDACSLTLLSTARHSQPSRSSKSSYSIPDGSAGSQVLYFDGHNYALLDKQRKEMHQDQQPADSEFEDFIQKPPYPTNDLALEFPDHSDTLSIIDEVSLCDSRHDSMRKTGLTTLPSLRMKGREKSSSAAESSMSALEEPSRNDFDVGYAPHLSRNNFPSPILLGLKTPRAMGMHSPLKSDSTPSPKKSPARRKPPPIDLPNHSPYIPASTNSANPFINENTMSTSETGIKNSAASMSGIHPVTTKLFAGLLDNTRSVEIDDTSSPTCSDGDKTLQLEEPLNFHHYGLPQLLASKEGADRHASNSSGASFSSRGTNDSLQNSIDLRLSPSRRSVSYRSSTLISGLELQFDLELGSGSTLELEPGLESDLKDVTEEFLSTDHPTEPLHLGSSSLASLNSGSGLKFSFPNNDLNVTNTAPIKTEFKASTSRRQSFVLPNGQIEIPNCDAGWSTGAEGGFDILNPSQQYTRHTKSKSTPAICSLARLPPSPKRSSPVRHQRHKSMHNIAYGASDFATPAPTSFKFGGGEPAPQSDRNDTINYVVEEPPARVIYPIDFKEAEPRQQSNSLKSTSRSEVSHSYTGRVIRPPSINNRGNGHARLGVASSSSEQSYGSFSALKSTSSVSDVSNIMIDLTKGNYNVCTINRTDSVLSYKSVTEKDRSGREVEVVLVDEDNDTDHDELLSIYSKYNNDEWIQHGNPTASPNTSSSSHTLTLSKIHKVTRPRPERLATREYSSTREPVVRSLPDRAARHPPQERVNGNLANKRLIDRFLQSNSPAHHENSQSQNVIASFDVPHSPIRVGKLNALQPPPNDWPSKHYSPRTPCTQEEKSEVHRFDREIEERFVVSNNRGLGDCDYVAPLSQHSPSRKSMLNVASMDDYDFSSYQ